MLALFTPIPHQYAPGPGAYPPRILPHPSIDLHPAFSYIYDMYGLISHISRVFGDPTPITGRPYIVSFYEHQEFF